MAKAPIVAGVEIRSDKIVVMVGEAGEGGLIDILGMGESSYGSNGQSLPDGIREAADNASENSQCCIRYLHLVSNDTGEVVIPKSEGHVIDFQKHDLIPETMAEIFNDPNLKEDFEVTHVLPKGYCAALAVTSPEQRKSGVMVLNASETTLDYAVCRDDKWIAIGTETLDGKGYGEAISIILDKFTHNPALSLLPEVIVTGLKAAQEAIRTVINSKSKQPCRVGSPTSFSGTENVLNPDYSSLLGVVRHGILNQPAYKPSAWGDFSNFLGDIWSDIKLYWRIKRELRNK